MLEGLEHVSDLIARFAWVETLYLHASTPKRVQLQKALVGLYVKVLKFLAHPRRYYAQHTPGITYWPVSMQIDIANQAFSKDI